MFDNSLLLEIVSRASNLFERTLIVDKLLDDQRQVAFTKDISPLDNWKIKKLAGKLSGQLIKDYYQRGTVNISIINDLEKLLLDYQLYQLNLHQLSDSQKLEFIKPHIQWLQVYQAALLTLDLPRDNFSLTQWYETDIYYGKFAKVCEPFLRLLQNKLQSLCNAVNLSLNQDIINPQVVTDIQLHLLNRFEMSLAWALEADINVYCSQNKIPKSQDNTDAYINYLEKTFQNKQDYHRFYDKFPVLARTLAQSTKFICNFSQELIQRLTSDTHEISHTFFGKKQITQIKAFNLGKSDYHAGGKSVVIVELELDNSESATIVYKPRCLKSEAAMQDLLATFAKNKVVEFASYQVLCKDGYGYAEFILANKNYIQKEEEIPKFYQQLGGYLAIFHILGGSDLHYENILVADGNAFICDCETVLEVVPPGRDLFSDTMFDSVFKTALLTWPRDNTTDSDIEMNISGYSGGESYQIPFAVPKINDHRMSLAIGVEHQVGIRIELEATNRIYYNGQLVRPQDYKNCIVEGFNQVYDWFQENSPTAITLITELFAPSLVRFINWGTEAYAKLIVLARHPKCLAEPLEVDLLFHSLIAHRRQWDKEGKLADLELAGMWQLDIPLFTAKATSSDELIYNYQQSLPDKLVISPLDNAIKRIEKLTSENRNRQNHYIYTSLSTEEINSPHFITAAVNYAQQIGSQLCEMLQPPSSNAPWKNYEFTSLGKRQVNIRGDLYDGTAGICLFLAYLDAIQPQLEFRQVAERSLTYSIEQRNTTLIGAFQGTTGLIYLLTHLAQLWNQPSLLDLAVELTDELIPQIHQDYYFDILHGVAGIIPVMLNLAEATSGKGIDCAHQCAQHLLEHATYQDNTLSWRHYQPGNVQGNLTGFSHGAGGIAWALILLGCHTQQSEYIQAGRQAFAYESTKFNPVHHDWYDLRTSVMTADPNQPHFANAWCNGAAGIGLSRIASWANLGKTDDDILSDAYMALNTTLRNFQTLGNDSLCHGKAGNAELLLRFSLLKNEPSFQMEANVQAQAQWHNFEKARYWTCGTGGNDVSPDLMLGLAGIGMHFLRLAYPLRVPSPLLLDPPPKSK